MKMLPTAILGAVLSVAAFTAPAASAFVGVQLGGVGLGVGVTDGYGSSGGCSSCYSPVSYASRCGGCYRAPRMGGCCKMVCRRPTYRCHCRKKCYYDQCCRRQCVKRCFLVKQC